MEENLKRNARIFNSPLEAGFRALILLNVLRPHAGFDLQHLVILDYILTHSSDISDGPQSLHADIPQRASAISVRRKLLEAGLELMINRDLVLRNYSPEIGVTYKQSDLTEKFLSYFESKHFINLVSCAQWIKQKFGSTSSKELNGFFSSNFEKWNSEFSRESLERIFGQ